MSNIKVQSTTTLPASTVVLVRPDQHGRVEVFMNRRPENMETYAGVFVFPGGRVESEDFAEDMLELTCGLVPAEAKKTLGSDLEADTCMGYWVGAVRELFEEAGIHFFVANRVEFGQAKIVRLASLRQALQRGEIRLSSLLRAEELRCDLSRLKYFYHRVTPDHYKVRFDTRFFLAALPENQTPLPHSEEVAESLWITPQAALTESDSGNFPMMPPTVAVLRTFVPYQTWAALRQAFALS